MKIENKISECKNMNFYINYGVKEKGLQKRKGIHKRKIVRELLQRHPYYPKSLGNNQRKVINIVNKLLIIQYLPFSQLQPFKIYLEF